MKKFVFDKRYLKISIYVLAVILLSICFDNILDNYSVITGFLKNFLGILSPFFIGLFLAYLLNPLLVSFENMFDKVSKLDSHRRLKRSLSLVATYLLSITLIIWLTSYLIPEIINNIANLLKVIPAYVQSLESFVLELIEQYPEILGKSLEEEIESIFKDIINVSASVDSVLNSTFSFISGTMSIASKLLDMVLGIIISIYVLADKEKFARQSKKILYTLLNKDIADKIMAIVHDSNEVFENFLVGKIIDSSIICVICFVGLTLLQIPYSLLISIIVGITNMIPYFGPFIGAVPAIFITVAATMAEKGILPTIWVAIFILILQQFDGNILGPKILGDSTGLSPFWIIFAITIGGAIMGVLGMFIGVPIFAVIYTMFSRFINRKYSQKLGLNSEKEGIE